MCNGLSVAHCAFWIWRQFEELAFSIVLCQRIEIFIYLLCMLVILFLHIKKADFFAWKAINLPFRQYFFSVLFCLPPPPLFFWGGEALGKAIKKNMFSVLPLWKKGSRRCFFFSFSKWPPDTFSKTTGRPISFKMAARHAWQFSQQMEKLMRESKHIKCDLSI